MAEQLHTPTTAVLTHLLLRRGWCEARRLLHQRAHEIRRRAAAPISSIARYLPGHHPGGWAGHQTMEAESGTRRQCHRYRSGRHDRVQAGQAARCRCTAAAGWCPQEREAPPIPPAMRRLEGASSRSHRILAADSDAVVAINRCALFTTFMLSGVQMVAYGVFTILPTWYPSQI